MMSALTVWLLDAIAALCATARMCSALLASSLAGALAGLRPERRSSDHSVIASSGYGIVGFVQELETLPIGTHLICPRRFYMHHGIYLGGGQVVHYSGFSASLKTGPVEVTSIERFAHGKPVWMLQEFGEFTGDEIVTRARSRIGERQYKLLSNNCEHFCSWCIKGNNYSAQVNAYLHCPGRLLMFISALDPRFVA